MKCEEEEACNYFSWTDSTNIGYNHSKNHKLCYLKNENSTGLRDKDGIVSGKKGCIMFQGMYMDIMIFKGPSCILYVNLCKPVCRIKNFVF